MGRLACVWVPVFSAAAVERCEPDLVERPLAVVRGTPPARRVVEANEAAREQGVAPGMTETEARARCPGLVSRPWSEDHVRSAHLALLEALYAVSPRVEDAGPGLAYIDTTGLDRLWGGIQALGEQLLAQARAVGLRARVGIAGSRVAARVAARLPRAGAAGRVILVPEGREAETLAAAPIDVLDLPAELAATLARWGLGTLGAVAAVPRRELARRLGPAGLRLHDLARGIDREPFQPWTPPPFWVEAQGLEWELGDLEALTAVLRLLLARLAARLRAAHVEADQLTVELALVSGDRYATTFGLAYPTSDVETLLRLARRAVEAAPPAAPVTGVAVTVRPVRARAGQGELGRPALPAHRDLATVLARLQELVGPDRCGAPVLVDSHRPDAVALESFLLAERAEPGAPGASPAPPEGPRLVLRRFRPPRPVEVTTLDERPVEVREGDAVLRVVTGAGPWRVSGEWWDAHAWGRDEWDVLLSDGRLCRLARDSARGWLLDGVYD